MRVIVHAAEEHAREHVETLLDGIELVEPPSLQEMCSLLYRDRDLIAVIATASPMFATMTIREWRDASVVNPIVVLLDDPAPGWVQARYFSMVLMAGADDVQMLAISGRELRARLDAISRRERGDEPMPEFCDCRLDAATGQIISPHGNILLTGHELTVLSAIVERGGLMVSKKAIMDRLYSGRDEAQEKIIDVYVCKLRKKIAAATGGLEVIETCWGQGFRFIPEGFVSARQHKVPA